ncbi:MAG TPA: response regulator transcription factor [Ignavibacteriales bacterium]|nr:response regulator transcription factor [Ignavibacteriales bacterium]
MNRVRIFIADDHIILRDGLTAVIESEKKYQVIGHAGSGPEAVERIQKLSPDLAIIDINMPLLNGIETTREIRKFNSEVKIIILTMFNDGNYIKDAIAAGANGYMLKMSDMDELFLAIDTVMKEERYLSKDVADILVSNYVHSLQAAEAKSELPPLTKREKDVLKLIVSGLTSQQISEKLFISYFTAAEHRKNIMKKLSVKNTVELVNLAVKEKLI